MKTNIGASSIEGKMAKPSLASRIKNVDKMELPKLLRYMRVGNILCSALQIFAGVTGFFSFLTLNITGSLVSLYVVMFGLLFLLYECRLNSMESRIRNNFGFLYTYKGRAGFIFFIGFLDFGMSTALGTLAGIVMSLAAITNLYVMYKHPDFKNVGVNADPTASYATGNQAAQDYLRANPQVAMQAGSFALSAQRV
ncbi:hypothetical protein SPRG_14360 [Saprolegnia parasitica CBS 223.65]|uniref:Golgi apparatus membrane protein TVP15 n=1 Tax=Saprolegnia parasitica (strain CBS 223.65) TaxID=695850 RepID=A0A067C0S0_SAPPC|nr:hypothetical protein SPRG_14360 [Saprolegnia parasitica CBS 223.65]KDO20422.1 hypothetical protein SPRG_14360 [Saprolegnia parasitica CBS 223.65]|eukprot:XP_012208878.1 hypothetical protein SPRG_14360 [Saprolegnia parasitica CBS 223.65]